MLFLLNLPLDYILQRFEEKSGVKFFSDQEIRRLADMCMRALA